MQNINGIRERFPDRLMDIEMSSLLKPTRPIKQIKSLEIVPSDSIE